MKLNGRRLLMLVWSTIVLLVLVLPQLATPVPGQAQEGAKIVVGIPGDPVALDPHQTSSSLDRVLYPVLYDRLVSHDANGKIVPELALKWEVSSDGATWTIQLRPGHRFHDNTPVNAEAVKQSFARILDPRFPSPKRSFWSVLKEVTVVDEYRVAFTTSSPAPYFMSLLADNSGSIVSPTAAAAATPAVFGRNPVGSGPYRFKEWVRGSRIVVERNPFHWLTFLRRSNVNTIEFRAIPDTATRAVGLETGELDFVTAVEPEDAKRLSTNAGLTVYNIPLSRQVTLYPDFRKRPFRDVKVRHAIAYAINKQALIDSFLFGFAKVSDSPLTPGVWSRKTEPVFKYDPQKAKQLLVEAGYPNGFTTNVLVPVGQIPAMRQVAEAVAEMLKAVGITANLKLIEHTAWQSMTRRPPAENELELSFWTWGNTVGDPDYGMRETFHSANWSPVCCNRNFYRNRQVDSLVARAQVEPNLATRADLYAKAQDIVWQEQAWIFLYTINFTSVGKKSLHNVILPPTEFWILRDVRVSR
jgi:ABC-type transport system substrate-binding protein